jgi:citrate/tricarballylate utilization protein
LSEVEKLAAEAQRQFTICNSCRYCEGYCAVFPAIERRELFTEGDLGYLANLCHDCRACYQACMYTEPHEFAMNIPQLMAEARPATYKRYARPKLLAALFDGGVWTLLLFTLISIAALFGVYAITSTSSLFGSTDGSDSFYRVVDERVMAFPALALSALIVVLCVNGLVAFVRDRGEPRRALLVPQLWLRAIQEAASLRWLGARGNDCYYPDLDRPSPTRRITHHVLAYGFLITFASTVSAAFAQYVLGERPPYDWISVPVILGTVGGIAVSAASIAFMVLRRREASQVTVKEGESMDLSFLVALLLVSLTGIALLATQKAAGVIHAVLLGHLATVLAFFILLPYSKMMHAVYRFGALLRNAQEGREEERQRVMIDPA